MANLTLMALGSSAPEIMLAVLETIINLEEEPKELGSNTIVGSAAFNLLIITAISIVSVDEIKKVDVYLVFLLSSAAMVILQENGWLTSLKCCQRRNFYQT